MYMAARPIKVALTCLILLMLAGCRTRRQMAEQPFEALLDSATLQLEDGTLFSEVGPVRVSSKYYSLPTVSEVVAKLADAANDAMPSVLSATEDDNDDRAAIAFWVLAKEQNPTAIPTAIRRMNTGNVYLAAATADYIGAVRSSEAALPLIKRLHVANIPAAGAAARALKEIGNPIAVPTLVGLLGKRTLLDDQEIVSALGTLGDSTTIAPLEKRRRETERLLSERRFYRDDEQLQRNLDTLDQALANLRHRFPPESK